MSATLRNIRLTSIDLVREGANQEADICLFKSSYPVPDDSGYRPLSTPSIWPMPTQVSTQTPSGWRGKLAYRRSHRFDWIVEVTRV